MGINNTQQLAKIRSTLQATTAEIAQTETEVDASYGGEQAGADDITALRTKIAVLRALQGSLRVSEQFWNNEVNEAKQARKDQRNLTGTG